MGTRMLFFWSVKKQDWLSKRVDLSAAKLYILQLLDYDVFSKTLIMSVKDIGDWIIVNKTIKVKKRIVFNPRAFCWDTGKSLFLKKATLVVCGLEKKRIVFYFSKNRHTTWLIKNY